MKPISLYPCGHSFCIRCVSRLTENKNNSFCPMCNQKNIDVSYNYALLAIISQHETRIRIASSSKKLTSNRMIDFSSIHNKRSKQPKQKVEIPVPPPRRESIWCFFDKPLPQLPNRKTNDFLSLFKCYK